MEAKKSRVMIIINPKAGTSGKDGLVEAIAKALPRIEPDLRLTSGSGDATRLAHEAITLGYSAVVAVGGDGTVNETARALCDTDIPLGIIPCGSGNGLARHLGIPMSPAKAVAALSDGRVIAIDYATMNDKKFFCTCGLGFDAQVSEAFSRMERRGLFSYIRSTVNTFAHYRPEEYTIIANGRELTRKALLVAVCNASQYGNNAMIAPHASLTDNRLDISIVRQGNLLDTALVGFDLMTGNLENNYLVDMFQATEITIVRQDRGIAHLDGDPVEVDATVDIRCRPGGLHAIIPSE